MVENPGFNYEGSLSSEDDIQVNLNQPGSNFDFNLQGFKDEFLNSSSEEEEKQVDKIPVKEHPVFYELKKEDPP